ncbi:hypothetical protein LUZ60_014728 [Juncus effusus]|nr:hypothetical protein LUZ60_014728 [Juncus effusus]
MQQPPPPGGSQYGGPPPPDMSPFVSSSSAPRPMQIHAEAASPINSRPPPTQPSFEELLPGGAGGNFPDDLAGDETDRGGTSGNRWPRQETLALLKIRSEMDATFRDATLKGPLWEEVSRKLAELGYRRSAKKCKEKFENVHKYYKRTKENRTGRPDGKTYRFFSQLEALHSASPSPTTPTQTSAPILSSSPAVSMPVQLPAVTSSPATVGFSVTMAGSSVNRAAQMGNPMEGTQHQQPALQTTAIHHGISGSATPTVGISFSSNTESSESDDSDDEDTEEIGGAQEQGKRKRRSGSGSGGGSSKKIMQFFEGIMKQVMERQEAMQQKFLETIEKREQDRMIREEAWRRQEMARLSREQEILAQERAMAASRDAAVISFIQKMTGQNIPLPTIPAPVITVVPPPPPPAPTVTTTLPPPQPPPPHRSHSHSQPSPMTPPPQKPPTQTPPPQQQPSQPPSNQQPPHQQSNDIIIRPSSTEIVLSNPDHSGSGFEHGSSSTSSRWPKAEVHALIKIRSDMDSRYQEAGPKGPLWEEISAGMRRLGYNRSSKRCKEKWENINKYFKKVKESNKKRPEDSKTCPYFHQLDALYRNKNRTGSVDQANTHPNNSSHDSVVVTAPMTPQGPPQPISQQPPAAGESHNKIGNGGNDGGNNGPNRNGTGTEGAASTGGVQIQATNGGTTPTFYGELKKPEDIMKDLMERRRQQENNNNNYEKFDEGDEDSMEDEDVDEFDDDEDEEEEGDDRSSNQYKIQFQRPNVNVSGTGGTNQPTSSAPGATPGGNSFLAMVQ